MTTTVSQTKGRIGVLIEAQFDETEFRKLTELLPVNEYEVECISHPWNQKQLTFKGNDFTEEVTITAQVNDVESPAYEVIILISASAMEHLRSEAHPREGQPNQSPTVKFLRRAMKGYGYWQIED